MKKKPYNSSMKNSTLTRSRTYIVVPRDVPPENFITVSETRKVRKVGLLRCCLPPLAISFLVACLLAGVGFLVYRYNWSYAQDWPGDSDTLKSLLDPPCEQTEFGCCPDNRTVRTDKTFRSCLTHCVQGDCTLPSELCPPGYWGRTSTGCESCLCSVQGALGQTCDPWSGQCTCRTGYTGHKCNICPGGAAQKYGGCDATQSTDSGTPCSSQPCQGGGTCEEHDGTFTCYCTTNRTGKYCEKIIARADFSTAGFNGASYVELKPFSRAATRTSIELAFRAFTRTGRLLYTGTSAVEYVSLRLVEGYVEFEYSLGEEGPLVLTSPVPVQLGVWHTVKAQRYHQDGMLLIDQEEAVTGQAPGSQKNLRISNHTYIGFYPRDSVPGFQGCIKDFEFGNSPISLVSGREPMLVKSVELSECTKLPCSSMPCKNGGECSASGAGHHCDCAPGFFGSRCGRSRSLCSPNPCEGGGRCSVEGNQVACSCPPGRRGLLCEEDDLSIVEDMQADQGEGDGGLDDGQQLEGDVLRLTGDTMYTVLNRVDRRQGKEKKNDFLVSFRTKAETGVLLSTGDGGALDTLELSIVAGKLVFRAHMVGKDGQTARGVAVSRERVDDGTWHRAMARRNGRRLYVRLDDREVFTAEVGSKLHPLVRGQTSDREEDTVTSFLHTDGFIRIGGRADKDGAIRSIFIGDINHLEINGVSVDRANLIEA